MIVYPSCCSCLNDKPKKKGCACNCHRAIDWSGCPDCGAKTLSRNEKGEHLGCPTKKRDDVEIDSPPFRSKDVQALQDRGFERLNRRSEKPK